MSILYKLGHFIGDYQRGIADAFSVSGSHPSIDDPTAWMDQYVWGEGLLQGNKPRTKKDFIKAFTGWVYICTKRNAQSVASIPLRLYVTKPEKGQKFHTIKTKAVERSHLKYMASQDSLKAYFATSEDIEEVTEHPFLDLMENVNPLHNARDLKEQTTMYSDLTGECYWLMFNNELGIPGQIWVIPSQFMEPKIGKSLDNPIELYTYHRGMNEIEIPAEMVVMFTYPNPSNIYKGFSCVQGIADAVYIQNQMNEFETALFENKARMGGVVESTERIGEVDMNRLKETLKQKHKGAKQAGKTMFLPYGMKFNRDTMSPEELSFIEGRKTNRTEIMAAFDVPEGILTAENVNRSNAETAAYTHAKYGILPRSERISQKINERILPRYGNEKNKLFCAFDEVVPEDKEFNLERRVASVKGTIMTINEARAEMGLAPVEEGDVIYAPSNLVPLGTELQQPMSEGQLGLIYSKAREKMREMLNA